MSASNPAPLLTRDQAAEVVDICVRNEVADPERRDVLLGGIHPPVATNLRTLSRPRDQLEADINALVTLHTVGGMDGPPLLVWMANARRMIQSAADGARIDALRESARSRARVPDASAGGRGLPGGQGRRWLLAAVVIVVVGVAAALTLTQADSPEPAIANPEAVVAPTADPSSPQAAAALPTLQHDATPTPPPPTETAGMPRPSALPASPPAPAATPADTTIVETGDIDVADNAKVRGAVRKGGGSSEVKAGAITVKDNGKLGLAITEGAGAGGALQRVETGDINASGNAEVTLGEVK